jgi:hypothetical protein
MKKHAAESRNGAVGEKVRKRCPIIQGPTPRMVSSNPDGQRHGQQGIETTGEIKQQVASRLDSQDHIIKMRTT